MENNQFTNVCKISLSTQERRKPCMDNLGSHYSIYNKEKVDVNIVPST